MTQDIRTVVVAVCGGRTYSDYLTMSTVLSRIHEVSGIHCLVQGGCRTGLDALARKWARDKGVLLATFEAPWKLGPSGGPIRNHGMLSITRPDWLIAFPGGAGTKDCVSKAEHAGIKVARVLSKDDPFSHFDWPIPKDQG